MAYFFLILFPIFATVISLYLKVNFFTSIILFFVIPSFYLSLHLGKKFFRVVFFSLICGLLPSLIIEQLAVHNNIWSVTSIFTARFFTVPIEQILWGTSFVYVIIAFYEVFFAKKTKELINQRAFFLAGFFLFLFFFVTYFLSSFPDFPLFKMRFYYMIAGIIIFLIPIVVTIIKYPKIRYQFFIIALYFFVLNTLFEFVAIKLNLWSFPGEEEYVAMINLFNITIPVEEFFFFSILGSSAVLSYYCLFNIPKKNLS